MAAIFNFWGHFESYINNTYYKSETFLMPNKTFVDIFIGLLQKLFYINVYKDFTQSSRGHIYLTFLSTYR